MTIKEKVKDRKIGIIGMARSGVAAALLAKRLGGRPFVSDSKEATGLAMYTSRLRQEAIPYETGGHTAEVLASDYLIISPGVPLNVDIVKKARAKGLPIFSEVEFAFWACHGRIVAITGSNGKTTTTTLIGEILKAAGKETFVCGNIGEPFAEIADKITADGIAVLEISNYQLETIADFRPNIALILNLTPDHLDRHGSFEAYKKAKYRITENQTGDDCLILNAEDKEISTDSIATRANKKYFSIETKSEADTFVANGMLHAVSEGQDIKIIRADEIAIRGPHNLQNAAAAVCAALCLGITPKQIADTLRSFKGVEHRLEMIGSVAGVSFINDSKATNVDSVCYAVRSVDTPIYLIAGGREKGASYTPIINYGKNKIKGIYAIGEAREKIFNELGPAFPVTFAETLNEAVEAAFGAAHPGETVLLSPGCASFDMFENFEKRGEAFKKSVASLRNGKSNSETVIS